MYIDLLLKNRGMSWRDTGNMYFPDKAEVTKDGRTITDPEYRGLLSSLKDGIGIQDKIFSAQEIWGFMANWTLFFNDKAELKAFINKQADLQPNDVLLKYIASLDGFKYDNIVWMAQTIAMQKMKDAEIEYFLDVNIEDQGIRQILKALLKKAKYLQGKNVKGKDLYDLYLAETQPNINVQGWFTLLYALPAAIIYGVRNSAYVDLLSRDNVDPKVLWDQLNGGEIPPTIWKKTVFNIETSSSSYSGSTYWQPALDEVPAISFELMSRVRPEIGVKFCSMYLLQGLQEVLYLSPYYNFKGLTRDDLVWKAQIDLAMEMRHVYEYFFGVEKYSDWGDDYSWETYAIDRKPAINLSLPFKARLENQYWFLNANGLLNLIDNSEDIIKKELANNPISKTVHGNYTTYQYCDFYVHPAIIPDFLEINAGPKLWGSVFPSAGVKAIYDRDQKQVFFDPELKLRIKIPNWQLDSRLEYDTKEKKLMGGITASYMFDISDKAALRMNVSGRQATYFANRDLE
jgi:hypothetical protein